MAPVHVGVGHDHDLVVAGLVGLEVGPDTAADRRDDRLDLLAGEHLVQARALDVQDLSADRQDRLRLAEAALLGGSAGRVPFHDEELAARRLLLLAVRELARQAVVRESALAAGQVAGLARRGPRPRRLQHLGDQRLRDGGVLLQVVAELLVDQVLDQAAHFAGPELGLGLALELGLRELDRDHRGQTLAGVVPGHALGRFLAVLVVVRDVAVQRAGERRAEADQVGAAVDRVDVVREGVDALVVGLVVLERDLDVDGDFAPPLGEAALAGQADRRAMQRGAAAVQVLDERDQAALVAEVVALAAALVGDLDAQAGVQERELAQALREDVEGEVGRLRRSGRPAGR